ncbi:MAG TPA: histidine ammonia-lyase, partial [Rhizobiales bacterium]|nr:histidine ammonia-lyase [Hyphomicrobiales bacterium]
MSQSNSPFAKSLELTPGAVTLEQLADIYWSECSVTLSRDCKPAVERAAGKLHDAAMGNDAVYGVNTGFGKLASLKIPPEDTATLQRNLIISHCCGVGEPISRRMARLVMVLKLLSLGRGASGVRWELIEQIEAMLAKGVTPVIPSQGSVGASGDLAPLAHMTATVIGEEGGAYGGVKIVVGPSDRGSG